MRAVLGEKGGNKSQRQRKFGGGTKKDGQLEGFPARGPHIILVPPSATPRSLAEEGSDVNLNFPRRPSGSGASGAGLALWNREVGWGSWEWSPGGATEK